MRKVYVCVKGSIGFKKTPRVDEIVLTDPTPFCRFIWHPSLCQTESVPTILFTLIISRAQMESKVLLAPQGVLDPSDMLDQREWLEIRAPLAPPDSRGPPEALDVLELLENKDPLVPMDPQEMMVPQEGMESLDHQDPPDPLVPRDQG